MQFQIDNMACGGCARSVTKAIHSDLNLKRVTVESSVEQSAVAAGLEVAGFPPHRVA